MADVVQYKLEKMVRELDDLERRGIFTHQEIAEIVKQRRKFEYRLKRPSPLKQDFLTYIDYEKQLDSLRVLRRKAIARHLKDKKGRSAKRLRKTISDFAGVSRIMEIYRLATNRFKGDIQLWFQYLEFCRQRRNGRMKKVLAQVIRFHPKVPGVWIYAAAWEFDHNLNAAAARALMQSGLRACPSSEELWIEYLRMELTYLNKLRARKVALGEDDGTIIHNQRGAVEKQWRDENKELFMALEEKEENVEVADDLNGESKKKADLFQEQGLNILQVVYSGAIEALPLSFSLRARFLETLESSNLVHSEERRKNILNDMKRDFSKEAGYWDWLARREAVDPRNTQDTSGEIIPNKLPEVIQVYEEALRVVPSAMMFNLYLKYLMDATIKKNGESQDFGCFEITCDTIDPIGHILRVYEKAERMECMTEDIAYEHLSFLLQLGRLDEAKMLAEKLCNGKHSNAVSLWGVRFSIEMKCLEIKVPCQSKVDMSSLFELFRNCLMRFTIFEAESLWFMALKIFTNHKKYFDKMVEISFGLLAKYGGSDDGFSLPSTIVTYVLQKAGVQSARDIYKRYLALPRPGLVLYRCCIQLELNLAYSGDSDCLVKARKLFESALSTYDQDVSLWRDYYSMEMKMGTSETAAAVHWRARKKLKDNVLLVASSDL